MADYELVEPFDIDGSLGGLSKEQCFTLGVEWAMLRARILAGEKFTASCHSANVCRLTAIAERHGRFVEHRPHVHGWSLLFVGDLNQRTT